MIQPDWWPEDYFDSRRQFIASSQQCGAALQSYWLDSTGPQGERLSVDVASFVSDDDEHRIILSSGLHGVEGFIGAAIQIKVLQWIADHGLPKRTGVELIHAANPWGYAHLRRVNENNIDINRNFIDFNNLKPRSHKNYAALDSVINPKTAPGMRSEIQYWRNAIKLITLNRGIKPLAEAIAQGQYDHPKGLFYGGAMLSNSSSYLQNLVKTHAAHVDRVTLLDIHSGLGSPGRVTLIGNTNASENESQTHWIQNQYQQTVLLDSESDNAYQATGSWSQWCEHELSRNTYLYLCVEIGTVGPIKLFNALRRENQAHHWAEAHAKINSQAKQALRDVFAPQSTAWRRKAIAAGFKSFERSLELPTA